jgi:hypothetical protein
LFRAPWMWAQAQSLACHRAVVLSSSLMPKRCATRSLQRWKSWPGF